VTVVLLAAAAAALSAAAALGWARQPFRVPLRADVPVQVAGSAVQPALVPLALLVLAAVAAALATGGWARRALGLLLVAAAVPPALAAARTFRGADVTGADLPARAEPAGAAVVLVAGPLAAVGGAALLAAAGVLLAVRGHRMPRMGARYRTPAAARTEPAPDRERGLWDSLDAGRDPTAEGHPEAR